MNILDAFKSGKKAKRPSWNVWFEQEYQSFLSVDDILATDWEIESESEPKLKAWIFAGQVYLYPEDNPPTTNTWKRVPWLDEK